MERIRLTRLTLRIHYAVSLDPTVPPPPNPELLAAYKAVRAKRKRRWHNDTITLGGEERLARDRYLQELTERMSSND